MYTAELDDDENGLAESVYGALVPRTAITEPGHPNAHLLHTRDGEPVLLDGEEIDREPTARLASPAQRTALAFRDRHCTYPGCSRPPTWSLHAHHRAVPSGRGDGDEEFVSAVFRASQPDPPPPALSPAQRTHLP
jgi:hypothetical protein